MYVVWYGVLEVPAALPKFHDQTGWQFGSSVVALALKVNSVPGGPFFLKAVPVAGLAVKLTAGFAHAGGGGAVILNVCNTGVAAVYVASPA